MPKYTLESGGKKYTFSSDSPLSDSDLQAAAAQAFGQGTPRGQGDKFQPTTMGGPKIPSIESPLGMRDPLYEEYSKGLSSVTPTTPEGMLGGLLKAGQPEKPDIVQKVGNVALPMLATAPTIAAAGAATPAMPLVGESLMSGIIGGAESVSKGQSPLWGFGLNAATTGATGGLLKAAPHLMGIPKVGSVAGMAEKGPAMRGAFAEGKDAMMLTKGAKGRFFNVPAIDPTKRLTIEEVEAGLSKLRGSQWRTAREQIVNELNRLDKAPDMGRPGPYAGDVFGREAPKTRVTSLDDFAEKFVDTLDSTALRALAEAIARKDIGSKKTVMPIGAAAGEAATMGAFGGAHSIYNTIKGLAR